MDKEITIIDSGAIYEIFERDLPKICRSDPPKIRAQKTKPSSEKQKFMNLKRASQAVERLLAKNYPTAGSGRWYTLTYSEEHIPRYKDPKAAREKVRRDKDTFLAALKRNRRRAKLTDPVAVGCIEVLTSKNNRWHIHVLIDSTGDDDTMVARCWKRGTFSVVPLRVDKEKNHKTLANYMTKEMRELQDRCDSPGAHVWFHTRNVIMPEVDTVIVSDDCEAVIPRNSEILEDQTYQTEYARWRYIKVRINPVALRKKIRAFRKKRRRL